MAQPTCTTRFPNATRSPQDATLNTPNTACKHETQATCDSNDLRWRHEHPGASQDNTLRILFARIARTMETAMVANTWSRLKPTLLCGLVAERKLALR
eukprot:5996538-Alexandrium_andersonii.AAC.1